jgi:hypothetical protein
MARSKAPRDYHEPWFTARSTTWDAAFRFGPPARAESPEELSREVADWHAKRAKAEADADWIVWGSRLAEPAACTNLDGSCVVADDRRIVTMMRRSGFPEGAPTHEQFARRVVACVNACAGIANPESFVAEVRSLLLEFARNEADHHDSRVLSLLARCIPPGELDQFSEDDFT